MQINQINLLAFNMTAERKLHHLSSGVLARSIGTNPAYISMIETELRPLSSGIRERVEKLLDTSLELTEEQIATVKELTETIDPKLLLISASVIEHRLKHTTRETFDAQDFKI